ncbi:hypothetical protein [Halorientalis marina]|uniref:hypothetical protein n=1 Tax=Halorientalis marina TaxID=2931976 RepID=UPI001FF60946|nr:hypothetical protein [Halorientalis marina]
MTSEKTTSTSITDHSGLAEQLLRVYENFADEFSRRDVPVHLSNVSREGKYLKGKKLGQHPERFVEQYLIWPTLRLLDYEFWAQPYGYPKWNKTRPDFAIKNFDCGLDCAVIGEVKTPNKFEYGEEQMEDYLKSDLGEATVGITTDGVRWKTEARPEKSPEILEIVDVNFHDIVRKLPSRHEEQESYSSHRTRQEMEMVESLERETVEAGVSEALTMATENYLSRGLNYDHSELTLGTALSS